MILSGWTAIGKRVGVAWRGTLEAYARRRFDPLPVMLVRGVPTADSAEIDEWKARRWSRGVMPSGEHLERIVGRTEIAARIGTTGVHVATMHRLIHRARDPLPVQGKRPRKVWIYASALRDWLRRQEIPYSAVCHRCATSLH